MKLSHKILFILALCTLHLYSDCVIELKISGSPYFTEKIISDAVLTGKNTGVDKTIERVLDFYVSRSFPFAAVTVDSVMHQEEKDILFLNIDSGDYVVIGDIGFKGAKITKKKVLMRQSRMKTGERFDERTAVQGLLWLYKSGLFIKKPEREFFRHDKKYGINYILSEKKYNELMLLGGYSSEDEKDNLSVTAEIRMDNIFGTMRKASILWDRSSDLYENLKLKYSEPFFFSADISTEIKYTQKFRKDLSLTRSYSAMQSYSFDPSSELNYGYSGQSVYPDSSYSGNTGRITSDRYSAGLKYSTIYNRQTIPRDKGFGTEIMFTSVNISIEDSVSISGVEIFAGLDYVFSPFKQIFAEISPSYNHIIFKEEIPDFNRIFFGGAGSLRGYREDFFQSDILIKWSFDFIFVTDSRDLAFRIFYDAGYYNSSRHNIERAGDLSFVSGTGGGMTFEGNSGYIELTAGIPLDRDIGDSVLHVKYSVRF